MPYIVHDEENGRFFHVSLSDPSFTKHLEKVFAAQDGERLPASDEDEACRASVTLEEAMARVMDQVLAREGDTHALWRHLNETWKP